MNEFGTTGETHETSSQDTPALAADDKADDEVHDDKADVGVVDKSDDTPMEGGGQEAGVKSQESKKAD